MIFVLATLVGQVPPAEIVIVRAERLKDAAPINMSLSGELLENQTGVRLDEVLRAVPGAGLFRRTASGAANATIQGLSLRPIAPNGAGRALVSLDGVPQNDPFGGWINWSRYDPIFLEKIEVLRGGAGAGYGPMALTGTLDVTEARGQPALFDLNAGNFGALHAAGRGSVRSQGAIFTAMAAYDSSDGTIGIARRQRGPVDQPLDYTALSLALVTDIVRDTGSWSFRVSGFDESKGAGLIGGQSRSQGLDISIARRFEGDWGQSRFILYAQGRDFTNQTVAVTAGRVTTTPALDQYATPSAALGGSLVFVPSQQGMLPSLIVEARRAEGETYELFRYIGKDFTRTRRAGGHQDLIGLGISLPRAGTFGASDWRLDGGIRFDYWTNSAGMRLETDRATGTPIVSERAESKSGLVATGRLLVGQATGPVRLSLYRTFRPPTLNELHRPFRIGNDVTEANAALLPETLIGVDAGLVDVRTVSGGRLSSSVTVYLNRLDDPIANVTLATGPGVFPRVGFLPASGSFRERRNVGRITARGLEGQVSWTAGHSPLRWSLAASTTDARVHGGALLPQLTGKRPAQAPRWSAVANLIWPVTNDMSAGITIRGESARFEDDLNTRKLAAYGTFDAQARWRINASTELYVTAENLMDTAIATAQSGDGIVALTQGRTLRLGVKFTQ